MILRSERLSALLLLTAAVLGLVIANTPAGPAIDDVLHAHLAIPATPLDLSISHWVTDFLLAIFFFSAAIELKHELTHGELDSPRKAMVPVVAAVGGVVTPAVIYLLVTSGSDLQDGWPIPTATDIAFALGVLGLVGRGLPARIRALLLGIAVIDDLIAILIIAFFFTSELAPLPLLLAVPVVLVFGLAARRVRSHTVLIPVLILLGLVAWALVYSAGVHATIAGVALGLLMPNQRGQRARHAVEPWVNGAILPVFAFVAAFVVLPEVGIAELSPSFWAVLVALPVGKLIGITFAGVVATRLQPAATRQSLPLADLLVVSSLAGIGFTVSLLMNELAFEGMEAVQDEGTLAVLLGSLVAAIVGSIVTVTRVRTSRRRGELVDA